MLWNVEVLENMKTLIIILFFGKSILLSDDYVNIMNNWIEFNPKTPIEAITESASIIIQLSEIEEVTRSLTNSKDIFSDLNRLLPKKSIEAELIDSNGHSIKFSELHFAISDFTLSRHGSVSILLSSSEPIPVKHQFKTIKIKSATPLNKVKVFWKNYSE